MATAIEYQKLLTEVVYINVPGPAEAAPGMSGGELLHGFLTEVYRGGNAEFKEFVNNLCMKWNVHFRETKA